MQKTAEQARTPSIDVRTRVALASGQHTQFCALNTLFTLVTHGRILNVDKPYTPCLCTAVAVEFAQIHRADLQICQNRYSFRPEVHT